MSLADPHAHEIIIVKHRGDDHDEGHHGGAWKIAFADFMTAMMCFFLVMWLINAANEETKAAVASYFNPVKLIDRNSNRRGLDELENGPQSHQDTEGAAEDNSESETSDQAAGKTGSGEGAGLGTGSGREENAPSKDDAESRHTSDDHLFSDPYAVLAEIAGDSGTKQNVSAKGDGGAQTAGPATGASGGEAYRDPFAPDFWSRDVLAGSQAGAETEEAGAKASDQPGVVQSDPSPQAREPAVEPAVSAKETANVPPAPPSEIKAVEPVQHAQAKNPAVHPEKAADKAVQPSPHDQETAREIGRELEQAFGKDDRIGNGIAVVPEKGGIRISLTDQLDFGMFELGSAVPRRELVLAMEKIGRILAGRKGSISIHGHTDARPFASKTYDNWRLSSARAQAAYYMLVRGGLDETRIAEVAGHADRDLKLKDKPFDAANRRIEIILETGT